MTRHATTRPLREGAIMDVPRAHRRLQLREVARRRKSGDWGEWVTLPVDRGIGSEDWLLEIRMIWRNQVFAVLGRPVEGALHLAIGSLSGIRPTWWEAQRIKDELAGEDRQAVEIYPPRAEVVDAAPMYHLWVLDQPLPFSISE